jgi:hypothetical protein
MGCFAKGCLTLVIAAIILCGLLVVGAYMFGSHFVERYTSPQPAPIEVAQPGEAEIQAARAKADALHTAARNNAETTVEFSAADLNALIASDPDLEDLRGHSHVAIANSQVTLDLSLPLKSMHWNTVRTRWFNGHVRLSFIYDDGHFHIDIHSAEANGHGLPRQLLGTRFSQTYTEKIREGFWHPSHPDADQLWKHIKRAAVEGDKLIVTTGPI